MALSGCGVQGASPPPQGSNTYPVLSGHAGGSTMDNHNHTPAWIFGIDMESGHQHLSNSGFVVSKKGEISTLRNGYESGIDVLQKDKPKLL
eukprot:10234166-Karenia_brevis.AAC.1